MARSYNGESSSNGFNAASGRSSSSPPLTTHRTARRLFERHLEEEVAAPSLLDLVAESVPDDTQPPLPQESRALGRELVNLTLVRNLLGYDKPPTYEEATGGPFGIIGQPTRSPGLDVKKVLMVSIDIKEPSLTNTNALLAGRFLIGITTYDLEDYYNQETDQDKVIQGDGTPNFIFCKLKNYISHFYTVGPTRQPDFDPRSRSFLFGVYQAIEPSQLGYWFDLLVLSRNFVMVNHNPTSNLDTLRRLGIDVRSKPYATINLANMGAIVNPKRPRSLVELLEDVKLKTTDAENDNLHIPSDNAGNNSRYGLVALFRMALYDAKHLQEMEKVNPTRVAMLEALTKLQLLPSDDTRFTRKAMLVDLQSSFTEYFAKTNANRWPFYNY